MESLPLPYLNQAITGQSAYIPSPNEINTVLKSAEKLLREDNQDMLDGIYPLKALLPDNKFPKHLIQFAEIISDSVLASWRRRMGETKKFNKKLKRELNLYPEYYRRNFHHQTDGYLSPKSAELYEHQVEILFHGLANPMRRRILKPMKKKLNPSRGPLKILELGAGCGTFTRLLGYAFPTAHITALDISPYYLQHARKKYYYKKNIDFVQGKAEDLNFKDQSFDAVISVFLLHELPAEIREKVLKESLRVLKPDGFWGHLDSLQLKDTPDLDWALESFPINFHEPFYKNYISTPLKETLLGIDKSINPLESCHHFSKLIYF